VRGRPSTHVGTAAGFTGPYGIVTDGSTIYISDEYSHCIRKVTIEDGAVTTLCGSKKGLADGQGADARFDTPRGLALDNDGNLIVADTLNDCIRMVTPSGKVKTLNTGSDFSNPHDVAVDGNNIILVANTGGNCIQMIVNESGAQWAKLAGSDLCISRSIATMCEEGKEDGDGARARFDSPGSLAVDEQGRLLVVDLNNSDCVRVVEALPSLAPPRGVDSCGKRKRNQETTSETSSTRLKKVIIDLIRSYLIRS